MKPELCKNIKMFKLYRDALLSKKIINNESLPKEIEYNKEIWKKIFNSENAKLRMTDVGVYSITYPYMARGFVNMLRKYSEDNNILIRKCMDVTSGLGGMLRYMCCDKIISIERNKVHYNILKSNMRILLSSKYKTIKFINDDYTKIYNEIEEVDMIVCDPPWGGRDYRENEIMSLNLGSYNIIDLINILFNKNKCRVFGLLTMENYNFEDLEKLNANLKYKVNKMRNVYLVIISKK